MVMVVVASLTATLVTNGGPWVVGVLALMVYTIFAVTPYVLPRRIQ
jgi:Ca2+:H+ antiporter